MIIYNYDELYLALVKEHSKQVETLTIKLNINIQIKRSWGKINNYQFFLSS